MECCVFGIISLHRTCASGTSFQFHPFVLLLLPEETFSLIQPWKRAEESSPLEEGFLKWCLYHLKFWISLGCLLTVVPFLPRLTYVLREVASLLLPSFRFCYSLFP